MRKYFLILTCLLPALLIQAQSEHPIEKLAGSKLEDAMTTADMMAVQDESYQRWEHLLGIVYGELRYIMTPATFAAFENSQKAWEAYRDAEFNAINRLYYAELQGSMWRPVAVYARKEVIRKRADDLMELYWLLKSQSEEDPLAAMGKWQVTSGEQTGAILEMGDDFTAQWIEANAEKSALEFYIMTNSCQGEKDPEGKPFLTFARAGQPNEQRCYKLQQASDNRLELVNTMNNQLLVLNRVN